MFYSGNGYCSPGYAVGVARSSSALGPYLKKGDPILTTATESGLFVGPGHCSVIPTLDNKGWTILYHAWEKDSVCTPTGIRELMVS